MFFDGGCPLCRREVAHYQKLDTAKRIRWVNIDTEPEALEALSIAPTDAMRRLHVLTPEGKVVSGARAFATIWSELPYYRRLSNVLQRLHILQPLELCYELFARWRFRRRVKTLSKNRK